MSRPRSPYRPPRELDIGRFAVLAPLALAALVAGLLAFRALGPLVDETTHYDQVLRAARGDGLHPDLTTWPTLHLLLSLPARIPALDGLGAMRAVVAATGLAAVLLFRRLAIDLHGPLAGSRALQFLLLPILFPFFLLLYTDVPSLAAVLAALWALERGRPALAAIAGIAAVAIRQNAIVWLAFVAALFLLDRRAGAGAPAPTAGRRALDRARAHPVAVALFAAGGLGFLGLVAAHRGVAVGDAWAHPFPWFGLGNVFFALFVFFWLFLPANLAALAGVARMPFGRRGWLAAATTGVGLLYAATFRVDHPYNLHDPATLPWSLRNLVLDWAIASDAHRALFLVPILLGFVALAVTPLARPAHHLLHPFAVAALVPSWLIEQRYYLVPFSIHLLCRAPASRRVELAALAWSALLTALTVAGFRSGRFFL